MKCERRKKIKTGLHMTSACRISLFHSTLLSGREEVSAAAACLKRLWLKSPRHSHCHSRWEGKGVTTIARKNFVWCQMSPLVQWLVYPPVTRVTGVRFPDGESFILLIFIFYIYICFLSKHGATTARMMSILLSKPCTRSKIKTTKTTRKNAQHARN